MLQTQTVEPHTFSLLEELMALPALKDFALVGGTALSLLYGHRKSDDLDIFSMGPFENASLLTTLNRTFGKRILVEEKPPYFGIFCFIDEVKVDLVRHPHPLIRPMVTIGNTRMFSVEDIIAMKVQAVLGRGKKKDFWDIAELLQHFGVDDFVRFHKEKYSSQNLMITVPQAICYFQDAEDSEDPISLKGQTWASVKKRIRDKVNAYLV